MVHVNPLHPLFSLLILKKLWADKIKLFIKSYIHSSVVSLPDTTKEFVKLLGEEEEENMNNLEPYVFIRLIWKNSK